MIEIMCSMLGFFSILSVQDFLAKVSCVSANSSVPGFKYVLHNDDENTLGFLFCIFISATD
jgi:hypothetical protein